MRKPDPIQLTGLVALWLVTCIVSGAAGARADDSDSPLWESWGVSLGSFFDSASSRLRVAGEGEAGTDIDFEDDLGLTGSATLFKLRVYHRLGRRHEVSLGFYEFNRSGTRTIERDLVFNGTVYPASASVTAGLDTRNVELAYAFYPVRRERFGLGVSGGLVAFKVTGSLAARLAVGGGEIEIESSEASTQVPIPMIGVQLRGLLHPRVVALAHARVLPSVSVGDHDGSATSASVALEVKLVKHLRLGFSYDFFDINVDSTDRSLTGNVNWSEDGSQVYFRVVW